MKIPLIANGDILCSQDIHKLNRLGICDGFMIARGAIHNVKIFEEYKNSNYGDDIGEDNENVDLTEFEKQENLDITSNIN